jgi:hypothetical protein
MAWSTTTTYGSNNRPLSFANPIVAHLGGKPRPFIVSAVDTSGPTAGLYADDDAGAGVYVDFGGSSLPHDDLATGEDDLRAGYWICAKAPPVR